MLQIHSLKSRKELNGSNCKLLKYNGSEAEFYQNSSTARWKVQLESASSSPLSIKCCNLTLIASPPPQEEIQWFDKVYSIPNFMCTTKVQTDVSQGAAKIEFANETFGIREEVDLKVLDIVQIHSLVTSAYNGLYGKLEEYYEEKQRWGVKLQGKANLEDSVICVKPAHLKFVRCVSTFPLYFYLSITRFLCDSVSLSFLFLREELQGKHEIERISLKLEQLSDQKNWTAILEMESEALQAARSLMQSTCKNQQASRHLIYHKMAWAHQHLGLKDGGHDLKQHHKEHLGKAIEWYQQQLLVFNKIGFQSEEGLSGNPSNMAHNFASAQANIGNMHHYLGNHENAIDFFEPALIVFREAGDKILEQYACGTLYDSLMAAGHHSKAQEFAKLNTHILKKEKERRDIICSTHAALCK